MGRARTGEVISADRLTAAAADTLRAFRDDAYARGAIGEWQRALAILRYIDGEPVVDVADAFDVGRSTMNDWMRGYSREGLEGLRAAKPGRSTSRLSSSERVEFGAIVEAGRSLPVRRPDAGRTSSGSRGASSASP